jgi:DNA invertase Pin-like site-specific DNA recombinase
MEAHSAGEGNPVRAAAYQRISEIQRAGDEHGVTNQRTDQQRVADARGYQIVMSEADNDISAFTGKHRPGYQRVMAAAARGELDVILVFQTSRFWRNRSERAAAIEVLRRAGVSIIATRGPSLDLTTAYGRAMAGLLGEFDTMESEVKAERQQLANYQAALEGLPRKGTPRPFGWLADRIHADPAEAEAIAAGARAILAGGTLTGVARDWERRGLRPHQAPYGPLREYPWTRSSVREILANPRIAGISVYKGAEQGRGQWEPLLAEETWRAVAGILRNPRFRRPYPQGATSLLGGIALCRCGNYVTGSLSANGYPAYRCNLETRNYRPGPHVAVKRDKVDEHISMAVIGALAGPDAIHLLTPHVEGDVTALIEEEAVLRNRLSRLGGLFAEGQISEADLVGGRERGEVRLAEIAGQLAELGRESVLAPLVTAGDVAVAWEGLGLDLRRAVVDALMTVTLYPSGRGARTFDPGRVLPPGRGIVWKG